MSRQSAADRQAIERTLASLQALAGAGLEHVEIRKVLTWLGEAPPPPSAAEAVMPGVTDPQADPMTGCLPVTPGEVP